MVHFLQVFGSDYVVLLVCSKYSQTFYYVLLGNLPLRGSFLIMCFAGLQRVWGRGLEHGFSQVFCGLRIYLPFWYVVCQMRL